MVGAVVLAGLSALALPAGVARADDDRPWPGPPACSAVAERVLDSPRAVTCDDGQACPAIAYFFRVATSPSGC
jgi:hypothetical protein